MTSLTQYQLQLLESAEELHSEPAPSNRALAFAARQLVQATLPHQEPKNRPPEWYRSNGNFTLSIRPGYETDPKTKKRKCIGYPYGSIPRLLLFWMTTEAVRKQNRSLELGRTLSSFMRQLGLDPSRGGPRSDAKRLQDQMKRLFRASISFEHQTDDQESWVNINVTSKGVLWWDPLEPDQQNLFQSYVELTPEFFQAITAHPVPVDLRALRALKGSPLALDIYAWLNYRTYRVNQRNRSTKVTWRQLKQQLGADIADNRNFARNVKAALQKVYTLYPTLNVDAVRGGIVIHPGNDIIPAKMLKLYTFDD